MDVCKVEGCGLKADSLGLCNKHYLRQRYHKDVAYEKPSAYGNKRKNRDGYVTVRLPDHQNANAAGFVFEHIVVMVAKIGRPLRKGETVHHMNGIRDDNRPENLELWVSHHPHGQRISDLVAWAKEIMALYGEME